MPTDYARQTAGPADVLYSHPRQDRVSEAANRPLDEIPPASKKLPAVVHPAPAGTSSVYDDTRRVYSGDGSGEVYSSGGFRARGGGSPFRGGMRAGDGEFSPSGQRGCFHHGHVVGSVLVKRPVDRHLLKLEYQRALRAVERIERGWSLPAMVPASPSRRYDESWQHTRPAAHDDYDTYDLIDLTPPHISTHAYSPGVYTQPSPRRWVEDTPRKAAPDGSQAQALSGSLVSSAARGRPKPRSRRPAASLNKSPPRDPLSVPFEYTPSHSPDRPQKGPAAYGEDRYPCFW
ncbi:hypothetical protein DIPPA_12481 [Diplonema papillatum]|nr:hypothetical protein DIPPA_12481 [Diplonema papillatum]